MVSAKILVDTTTLYLGSPTPYELDMNVQFIRFVHKLNICGTVINLDAFFFCC